MRLLKDEGHEILSLVEYGDDETPPYAILSHTWGTDSEEVTLKDIMKGTGKDKAGYKKIEFCRKKAAVDDLQHFWVDTCCIKQSSSAELTEAINSMFRWYKNAAKCYVYLSDVSTCGHTTSVPSSLTTWEAAFQRSRWFRRGWTLQELIAPVSVEFFSQEGDRLGSKTSLDQQIHEITGIAIKALHGVTLTNFTVKERFSWASHRETKKPEDKAYSLLGIFNIYMPLLYGEGNENAFVRLREQISKSSNPLPSPSSTVPFPRDVDFIDRRTSHDCETLLEQIEQRCARTAARVALVGIGGAGKSQLAIEYCHRLRERSSDTWVFWIHASNTDRIEQGYREIAERVNIPGRRDLKENIFELVARWLRDEKKGTWLLVLDNLDDDTVLSLPQTAAESGSQSSGFNGQLRRPLSAYFPQSENGTILITTRTRNVATKLVEPRDMIMIDPMTDTDAVALLKKKLGGLANNQNLEELVRILEYMPLAIMQAAAYIQQKGLKYSVRQYIEAFQRSEKRKTSLLNYEAGHLQRDADAKNSIIVTWQISFDEIRKKWPLSADLLSLMSYFDRQGIPKEVLKVQLQEEEIENSIRLKEGDNRDDEKGKDREKDKDKDKDEDEYEDEDEDIQESDTSGASSDDMFDEAVDRLQSYSFVSVGENNQTFEMHGLVQLAMRKWLEMYREDGKWKGRFCKKLNTVFPTGDHENWGLCDTLFPHAKSAEKQRPIDHQSVLQWAQILRKAGWYALAKGDYPEAERMCERSARALREVVGLEDVETSYSLSLLASTYWSQGRWTEAEKMEVQVMETRKRVLGEEHPDTLTSMSNLASTYWNQGRWTEAEKMFVQVMETSQRVLGEEHPSTLTSMSNLASTYRNQGRWTEAEKMFMQVMETRKRVLGEEHPSTLTSIANLAFTINEQGRKIEAIKLMSECVKLQNQVLGVEHPNTLSSSALLAKWQSIERLTG